MILRSLLSVLLLFLWSCGGSSDKSDDAPVTDTCTLTASATYQSLWDTVFKDRCGACHGAVRVDTENGPDMRTQASFYASMVGKSPAVDNPKWQNAKVTLKDCYTNQYIKKNAASESLIMAIFDTSIDLGCVPAPHKDPPQSVCVSDGSLAALKKWIDNGAAQ